MIDLTEDTLLMSEEMVFSYDLFFDQETMSVP